MNMLGVPKYTINNGAIGVVLLQPEATSLYSRTPSRLQQAKTLMLAGAVSACV
jgi:hypothetical protein